MTAKDFLYNNGIIKDSIYSINQVNIHPDYWFRIVHRKGEHKDSWFKRLVGFELPWNKEIYKDDMLLNNYENTVLPVTDFVNKYIYNSDIYFYVKHNRYPIWFKTGILITYKDKYGIPTTVSSIYYVNLSKEDTIKLINDIVKEINNEDGL